MSKKFKNRIKKEMELLKEIDSVDLSKHNTVSSNSKTGCSFNYPLFAACPKYATKNCKEFCYVMRGHMIWPAFIKKTIRNYILCEKYPPDMVSLKISMDIPFNLRDFRWLGSGELTPNLVNIINKVVDLRPEICHYIYTKNYDLMDELHPKIFVNISVDASTPEKNKKKFYRSNHNKTYTQYSLEDNIPNCIDVIHPVNKKSEFNNEDKRICEFAYNKNTECTSCRRCIE